MFVNKSPVSSLISGVIFACAFVFTKKFLTGNNISGEKNNVSEVADIPTVGVAADIPRVAKVKKEANVPFEKISMAVDFPYVSEPGASPIIRNGRTMLPMHALAKLMGLGCAWNEYEQSVTLASRTHSITMVLGNNVAMVNGEEVIADCVAVNFKGVMFLPVRFVAESLGCRVEWNENKRELIIKK